ncbi:hypothetical protein [Flammeovirga sp. SJP92]|uniref:hypothetical protein n=1 Tax=Flammeovirga sp. SJP92 TaxID=1775430 RepID=UPI00078913CC|nr:hypothetical protein [Flammeovirga sp. SJP92]KXX69176.1 hypothetical protein AVL50_16515 [Flammeovirga sp. SJP92]
MPQLKTKTKLNTNPSDEVNLNNVNNTLKKLISEIENGSLGVVEEFQKLEKIKEELNSTLETVNNYQKTHRELIISKVEDFLKKNNLETWFYKLVCNNYLFQENLELLFQVIRIENLIEEIDLLIKLNSAVSYQTSRFHKFNYSYNNSTKSLQIHNSEFPLNNISLISKHSYFINCNINVTCSYSNQLYHRTDLYSIFKNKELKGVNIRNIPSNLAPYNIHVLEQHKELITDQYFWVNIVQNQFMNWSNDFANYLYNNLPENIKTIYPGWTLEFFINQSEIFSSLDINPYKNIENVNFQELTLNDWSNLSQNYGVKFSLELIEKYKYQWNLDYLANNPSVWYTAFQPILNDEMILRLIKLLF